MKHSKITPEFDKYFPRFMGSLLILFLLSIPFSIMTEDMWEYSAGMAVGIAAALTGYFTAKMDGDED